MNKKLKTLIKDKFSAHFYLDKKTESKKITGTLVWEGFVGRDQIERQSILKEFIIENFSEKDQLKIGVILTFTPLEFNMLSQPPTTKVVGL